VAGSLTPGQPATIDKVGCPAFITHGTADPVIPFRQGERLYEAGNAGRAQVLRLVRRSPGTSDLARVFDTGPPEAESDEPGRQIPQHR
jgi:hypothetical protein